jgi:hypothetical protein
MASNCDPAIASCPNNAGVTSFQVKPHKNIFFTCLWSVQLAKVLTPSRLREESN